MAGTTCPSNRNSYSSPADTSYDTYISKEYKKEGIGTKDGTALPERQKVLDIVSDRDQNHNLYAQASNERSWTADRQTVETMRCVHE
ncbi:hypothetical protein J6590_071470 [Homalodisca vitripennis]|nr:hypothetical protein J6590_071470 [Homalodisca vitripennis]